MLLPQDNSEEKEVIYTQEDLDDVLAKVRSLSSELEETTKEVDQLKQILWAVLYTVGKEVKVPYAFWLDASMPSPHRDLVMVDDPSEMVIRLEARQKR